MQCCSAVNVLFKSRQPLYDHIRHEVSNSHSIEINPVAKQRKQLGYER